MPGAERRRWKRLKQELPLELHLPDGDRTVAAVGSHMNPEGIFVRLADPPALGARVRVTLHAEATDGVLSGRGEVVDRNDGASGAGPPGVGIRLDETGSGWKKLYDYYVLD
jgi:hypothetical protein